MGGVPLFSRILGGIYGLTPPPWDGGWEACSTLLTSSSVGRRHVQHCYSSSSDVHNGGYSLFNDVHNSDHAARVGLSPPAITVGSS